MRRASTGSRIRGGLCSRIGTRCIEASREFPTLSANRWGLAPCSFRDHYFVHEVRPNVSDNDVWYDGVVPPYAAGSAIMFAPAESIAAMSEYMSLKGPDGKTARVA